MKVSLLKKSLLILLTGFFLTACTPKDVTVYQQEDELLNCRKLTGKIAELMHTNSVINENTGLEKTSLALWYLSPVVGVVNQVNASVGRDKIDERFIYLLKLKKRHGCRFTDKEIEFSKIKGKGRFSGSVEQWAIDYENQQRRMGAQK